MSVIREDVIRILLDADDSGLHSADNLINHIGDSALNAARSLGEVARGAAQGIVSGVDRARQAIRNTTQNTGQLRTMLANLRTSLANQSSSAIDRVRQSLSLMATSARNAVTNGLSRLRQGIINLPHAVLNRVTQGLTNLGNRIRGLPHAVLNRVTQGFTNLKNKIKDLPKAAITKVTNGIKSIGRAVKNLPKNAFKGMIAGVKKLGTAAAGAAKSLAKITGGAILGGLVATAGAVVGLGKKVVDAFAEMEQNVGGSETVFQNLGSKITSINANIQELDPSTGKLINTTQSLSTISERAYATMGISQSDYLASVNKMGSLFQGSGLTQQRSLDLSVQAMQRATDVASIMGVDQSAALEAVTGAAKGNYTMMDNLGVAMNATTLGAYAQAQGLKKTWTQMSNAEHAEVAMKYFFERTAQYAGNFEKEATGTVSGSMGLLKAAAQSLVAGLGDSEADIGKLTTNVVNAFSAVVKNIKPIIQNMFNAMPSVIAGLATTMQEFAPIIKNALSVAITSLPTLLPGVVSGVMTLFNGAVGLIQENIPTIVTAVTAVIPQVVSGLLSLGGQLLSVGAQLILQLLNGITPALPSLIQCGMSAVLNLLQGLASMFPSILSTAINIVSQIVQGIAQSLPMIGQQGGQIVHDLVAAIIGALPQLAEAIFNGLVAIITNLPGLLVDVIKGLGGGILEGIKAWFTGDDTEAVAADTGAKTCNSIATGITSNEAVVSNAMQGLSATAANSFTLDASTVSASTATMGTTFASSIAAQQGTFDLAMTQTATGASTAFATGITAQQPTLDTAMTTSATSAVTAFNVSMTSSAPAITSTATQTASTVKPPFDAIDLTQSGAMAGQGFANGLASKKGEIVAQAQSIASSVSSTVNHALDIHSPSRVAIKSAQYFDMGLIEGLNSLKPKVQRSAQEVSGTIHTSTSPLRGSVSNSTSSMTTKSQNTSSTYAPQFTVNLNGASASDSNKRKVQRWVKESIRESYESMSRTRLVAREV